MILENIDSEDQWSILTGYCTNNFKVVDFNILYEGKELKAFLKTWESAFIERMNNKSKIYYTGPWVRFHLEGEFKDFVIKNGLSYFESMCLEDPSFIENGTEHIAIVNHEDYAIFNDDFKDLSYFDKKGFSLDCEMDSFQ